MDNLSTTMVLVSVRILSGFVLFFYLYMTCTASTINDKEALYDKLVTGYHSYVRPGTNQSNPVEVDLGFNAVSMKGFDEKTGKCSISGYFVMQWIDVRLSWNPADYNGISFIKLPTDWVWVPDLIIENGYERVVRLRLPGDLLNMQHSGLAFWYPGNMFEMNCIANIAFYPFDVHNCSFVFTAWGYDISGVLFNIVRKDINYDVFTPNGKWNITSSSITTQVFGNIQVTLLNFEFTRRSHYEIINTVLPVILLEVLHVLVFLIPAESGERLGYATTMLLAITVYMTIVADRLPDVSYPNISYMSYFLLSDVISGFILIGCVIQSLRLHHTSSTKRSLNCFQNICKRSSANVTPDPPGDRIAPLNEENDGMRIETMAVDGKRLGRLFDRGCLYAFLFVCLVKITTLFSFLGKA